MLNQLELVLLFSCMFCLNMLLFNMPWGSLGTDFCGIIQDSRPLTHSVAVEIRGHGFPGCKAEGLDRLRWRNFSTYKLRIWLGDQTHIQCKGGINLIKSVLHFKINKFLSISSWAVCQYVNTISYLHILSSLNAALFFCCSFQAHLCSRACLKATSRPRHGAGWYGAVWGYREVHGCSPAAPQSSHKC